MTPSQSLQPTQVSHFSLPAPEEIGTRVPEFSAAALRLGREKLVRNEVPAWRGRIGQAGRYYSVSQQGPYQKVIANCSSAPVLDGKSPILAELFPGA